MKKFPPGTTNDIPNITVRLFEAKFKEFLKDIIENEIFGKVLAYVYSIEFQKRGNPHAHLILTLHPKDKMKTSDHIDKHISAEIPLDNEELKKLVIKHMLHGPHTGESPCVKKVQIVLRKIVKIKNKKFPKIIF